jgi:hypothetical protein
MCRHSTSVIWLSRRGQEESSACLACVSVAVLHRDHEETLGGEDLVLRLERIGELGDGTSNDSMKPVEHGKQKPWRDLCREAHRWSAGSRHSWG